MQKKAPQAEKPTTEVYPEQSPKCSIVIRAYNEERHISRLLDGIAQQSLKDIQIILVDSGSTDKTRSIAAQYPVEIVAIRPDEFTFGRSLNAGITHAKSDIIIIASAHVYPVYPDWLERMLAPFANPKTAVTYGKQRGNSNTKFSEKRVFAHWFPDHSHPHQTHPFCNNANAAIRRKLWEDRPYDESISGLEDLEWANWAVEQGNLLSYVAEAEVIHVHDESPSQVYNRYRREAMAFKTIFPSEKFNLGNFMRLVVTNISNDLRHATRQRVIIANLSSIFWFRLMQFWGTYRGYRHSGPLTWQLRRTFYYPNDSQALTQSQPRDIKPIQYNELKND